MSYSVELIDRIKSIENCSDNQVAKKLGVGRQFISNIRANKGNFSPEITMKAAKLANIDPSKALLIRFKETVDDLETRYYIERIEQQYQEVNDAS